MAADIEGKQISVFLFFIFKWKEPGVKFQNIRNNSVNAFVDHDFNRIWHPEILFRNTVPQSSTKSLGRDGIEIEVMKQSPPEPDDLTNLQKELVFKGTQNTLIKKIQSLTKFYCNFDTKYHPFSIHSCSLNMSVDTMKPEFTSIESYQLILESVKYKNFIVNNGKIEVINNITGIDEINISFDMKSQISNVITSAYLPMLTLNAICQLTIYLHLDCMFETILAVNATILVAISSFITSEIASLPKSEGMKPHEVWMLMMFLHPFLLIVVQVSPR